MAGAGGAAAALGREPVRRRASGCEGAGLGFKHRLRGGVQPLCQGARERDVKDVGGTALPASSEVRRLVVGLVSRRGRGVGKPIPGRGFDALIRRNAAWRERRRNPNLENEARFRDTGNNFHRVVRKTKKAFWSNWVFKVEKLQSNCPRAAVSAIRRRFGRNSTRLPPTLSPDSCASPEDRHACLAAWSEQFQHGALLGFSRFDMSHASRIQRRIARIRSGRTHACQTCMPFSHDELDHALQQGAVGKSPGCDNIPYEALRVDLPDWKDALLAFCNACQSHACVPTCWKHGVIVPIPKGAHSADGDRSRPITLTSCFVKTLVKMVLHRIRPRIDPRLDESQAGFRWGADLHVCTLREILQLRRGCFFGYTQGL